MLLIPYPKKLLQKTGFFSITRETSILLDTSCSYTDYEAALALQQEITDMTGFKPEITKGPATLLKKTGRTENGTILLAKALSGTEAAGCSADDTAIIPEYRLTVEESLIEVTGLSENGLFYGIQTLRQLVRNGTSAVPCVEVEDAPDFEYRGFYHDITRGKVPTLATLKELADRLSFYKLNQLQLYIEHSFAFRKHSEIWTDSDPITAEDILILDEYCKKRGIELVPSLSTFGHLYHALISKTYGHLNEYVEFGDTPYRWTERQLHYTLDVSNPDSIRFVTDMIDEFIPLFSSDKFNICCDETFDLGEGRNKALAEEVGKGKLYLFFANQVIKHVKTHGKSVMMWGDMLLRHPEAIKDVPSDVIILNWDYSPEVKEDGVKLISEAGLTQYVCPGVHGWNRLINNMEDATKNVGALITYAKKYKAKGVLNTDWGDFGHINLLGCSIPGAVYGAGLSWNADDPGRPSDADISRLEYGDGTGRVVRILRELSAQAVIDWETAVLWYYTMTGQSEDCYGYRNYYLQRMLDSSEEKIRASYGRIRDLGRELSSLAGSIYQNRKTDFSEFIVAAEGLALFQALLLVLKKKFLGQPDTGLIYSPAELAEKLEYWLSAYKKAWRERNRESELYRIKEVIMGICRLLRG